MIAFVIDDGSPALLQRTLGIIKEEKVPVTLFVKGSALQLGPDQVNFTAAYREMVARGHQLALHSMTHPPMEGARTDAEIDKRITSNIELMQKELCIVTNYFRPPYDPIGARTQ